MFGMHNARSGSPLYTFLAPSVTVSVGANPELVTDISITRETIKTNFDVTLRSSHTSQETDIPSSALNGVTQCDVERI